MPKKHFVVLLFILALGAFLRFYHITTIPPGLYPDEAMNGNNGLEATATGQFRVFYPENNGREGLFINIQAMSLWLFGAKPVALRAVSAVFGTLTILGLYLLAKELFTRNSNNKISISDKAANPEDKNDRLDLGAWGFIRNWKLEIRNSHGEIIGLLSAFFLATSYWHLNFSRIGFRAITLPFFATFGMYFLLKGLRKGTTLDLLWAGIFTGLGFQGYIAYRFMPFILAVPLVRHLVGWYGSRTVNASLPAKTANDKPATARCAPCAVALFLFVTFIVALPIGLYFLRHPGDFVGRSGQVSMFATASPAVEFAKSTALTFGMLFAKGDCNWRHNLACRSELNPLVAILFFAGVILGIRALVTRTQSPKLPFVILFVWLLFMMLPATFTREGLPHALRSIGMIPPVMILAGFGGFWIWGWVQNFLAAQQQRWQDEWHTRKLARIEKEIVDPLRNNFPSRNAEMFAAARKDDEGVYEQYTLGRIDAAAANISNCSRKDYCAVGLIIGLAVLMATIPLAAWRAYFVTWAHAPETYYAFAADLWHLGEFLNTVGPETTKYVIVNLNGDPIRGIPAPAQTVMFATNTFREEVRKQKNIIYIPLPSDLSNIDVRNGQRVIIAPLNKDDSGLIGAIREKFPRFRESHFNDFLIFQNF